MRLWQRSAGQILTLRLERADLFWRLLLGLLQADRYTGGGIKRYRQDLARRWCVLEGIGVIRCASHWFAAGYWDRDNKRGYARV
jgi:hypothetical protein